MQVTHTLLPGLHGDATLFPPLVKELGDVLTECIEYPTSIPQSYELLENWLIEEIDWDIPRFIIAESFSGPLALRLAKRFPESVQSLVLAASFCASPTTPNLALLPLRPLFMLSPPKRTLRHFLIGNDASERQVTELKKTVSKIPSKILSQRVRAILSLQPSDSPCLKNLPMLILQASDDNMIPWETQNQLRMRYEHATTHWLDGPHLILQSASAECAAIIKDFAKQPTQQVSYA
ncbi:MAG: alpha/beta hydrolase [Rubritalea sp.]|uniref:alpha/beta fold hydrolase n=1 Tax=Rubritalea sp. TaxID=2109375 RepID=UPI0032420E58